MRGLPAALLLAASGCAQLFGIDETTGPTVDPSRVSLAVQRYSIGASVQKNPQDLAMLSASWLVDDGAGNFTKTAGEQTAAGVWSAPLPTGMPPVMFTLPDRPAPITRLWAMPARDKKAELTAYEHPSPQEPLPNSAVTAMVTLPAMYTGAEAIRIEAIGAWTSRGLVATDGLPAPNTGVTTFTTPAMPYASFSPMTGSPAARITSQDVVVVEEYVGAQLTGIYQAPPFDQTDGNDTIMANIVPVPANRPINATATPAAYDQRYSAVRPSVTGLGQSWIINAAPGWSIGAIGGPRLHSGGVPSTPPLPATADIMTMYGNPFESLDWRSVFQFSTQETRSYTFMTVGTTLSASMYTIGEPANISTLDFAAGLPINIRANQVPLSTDGMTVPLDLTKAVTIDAITDKPAATFYAAALYEVTTDGMAVTKTVIVDALATGEPKVVLPADLFQVGHWYYVDFRTIQGGFVNAAMGDLQTFQLPFTVCRADSAVFQVVAP